MRNFYRIYGIVIESHCELPELRAIAPVAADFTFRCASHPPHELFQAFHAWPGADGRDWLSFARSQDNTFRLRFPEFADFFVSLDGREIVSVPLMGTAPGMLRHLLLDQVLPLVLSSTGQLTFHASAVEYKGRAAAFLAASGRGKSTLALALQQAGAELITDDCLVVDTAAVTPLAVPGYAGVRLWPESASVLDRQHTAAGSAQKRRVAAQAAPKPVPLHRLYVLDESGGDIQMQRLSGVEAFLCVLRYAFVLDTQDAALGSRQFAQVKQTSSAVGVCALSYPRDFAMLPALVKAIREDLLA